MIGGPDAADGWRQVGAALRHRKTVLAMRRWCAAHEPSGEFEDAVHLALRQRHGAAPTMPTARLDGAG